MSVRTAGWIGGAIVLLAVGLAAYLFVSGDSLAAIKILLATFFLPSLALFVVAGWRVVRLPGWYRDVGAVLGLMFLWGCVLVLGPILLYLPWAPMAFPLEEMPFPLPVIVWIGVPLVTVGATFGMVWAAVLDWRHGDRARAVWTAVLLGLIGLVLALRLGT